MSKAKNYLTTGDAAAIFNVDPTTILRWIKSGKIPAIRTPSGHYHINRNVILTKMIQDPAIKEKNENRSNLSYRNRKVTTYLAKKWQHWFQKT